MSARRGATRGPLPTWRLVTCTLLVTCLVCPTRKANASDERSQLAWQAPSQARIARWTASRSLTDAPCVRDPSQPTLIHPGELLLVPVAPGSLVRVEGRDLHVGLGTGTDVLPDAITWSADGMDPIDVSVPSWTMARFVVVRAAKARPSPARVLVAMPVEDAMAFYRADEQVAAWLFDGASTPRFSHATASHNARVRWLAAARDALGTLSRTPAGQAWLQARWLELAIDDRPIRFPFVAGASVTVRGGHPMDPSEAAAQDPESDYTHHVARAGERLVVSSSDADSVSLLLRTRATGNTDARVSAGASLFARYAVTVPRRAEDAARWTPSRLLRAPIDARQPVQIEVLRGEVWLASRSYRLRTSTWDARDIRKRSELLRQARAWLDEQLERHRSPELLWLRTLVELDGSKSSEATRALSRTASTSSLGAAAAALSWHELIVHGDGRSQPPRDALLELWRATESLPETARLVLRRSALERLADARLGPFEPPLGAALDDPNAPVKLTALDELHENGTDEERVRLTLAREVVDPPRDAAPSAAGVLGEHAARSWPHRRDLVWRARSSWLIGTSWTAQPSELDARSVMRVASVFDAKPGEVCSTMGPDGPRWIRFSRTARRVNVTPGQGTHVRVLVRGIQDAAREDSTLEVDGTPVVVHSASGLGSTVAVAPGPRNWGVAQGPPVMALVPTEDQLPCSDLLDTERWVPVDGWTRFDVPSSDVGTVISVTFDPDSLGASDRRMILRVGDQLTETLVRQPATGVVEAFVPAGVDTVGLYSESRVLARVRARLHPRGGAPRRVAASAPPSAAREADLLESVVRFTRALRRSKGAAERSSLWVQRAKLLDELGYGRLALADRMRAGSSGQAPGTAAQESQKDLELSPESGAVVPIGHLPKIPPLSVSSRQPAFERALARKSNGALATEVLEALGPNADTSAGADALLLAVLAAEVSDTPRAAAALERIGTSRPSPEALSWAAELYTDVASSGAAPPSASLKAYVVARAAAGQGAAPGASLARLEPALGWQDVGPESVAGVAWVEQQWVDADPPSPGVRLRRALLDAKPKARLLGPRPMTVGLTSAAGLQTSLEFVCHSLNGPNEGCRYALAVDGRPCRCEPNETSPVDDEVARPHRCRFTPPRTARRLTISPPPGLDSFGYVAAERRIDDASFPLVTEGQWWELDHASPMRLTVKGPTVLRVTGRAQANAQTTLELQATPVDQGLAPMRTVVALDPTPDATTHRRADGSTLGMATTEYVVLPSEGPQTVLLSATARAVVRVAGVVPTGRARPKTVEARAREAAPSPPARRPPPWGKPDTSRVVYAPEPGPVALGAYARATLGGVLDVDHDLSKDYLEIGVAAHRGALAEHLRLGAALFERVRQGPGSTGFRVELSGDLSPISPEGLPLSARSFTKLVTQDTSQGSATGVLWSLALMGRSSLSSDWTLAPMVSLTERAVKHGLWADADIDPDVTSVYARARPRSLDVALYLSERPRTDGLFRYGLKARLLPDFDGLDALDASASWRVLPGAGLVPQFEFRAAMSLRPASSLRDEGFLRAMLGPSVLFWRWLAPSQRVTLGLLGAYYRDFPPVFAEADGFSAVLELGYDFSWDRGLGDLSSGDRPFQQRLEEGSGQTQWAAPPRDAYWGGKK